jgi:hypothetical protein
MNAPIPAPVPFDWRLARMDYRRDLPHVVQDNVIYYVTLRLADSIPQIKLKQWKRDIAAWLQKNRPPHTPEQEQQYAELGYRRTERWLDRGTGSCLLSRKDYREAVEYCLRFGDGQTYWLGDFIIVPNHLHALVRPLAGTPLKTIVSQWRSVSTHKVNDLSGRTGQLWQENPFDHIVRSQAGLQRICRYIRNNARHLSPEQYTLGEGLLFT